jgi:hypothetical protein
MYIDKIDDLIDKILDEFYLTAISKNKIFKKIIQEVDFIKYQKELNDIMIDFINKIDINEIKDLVKSNSGINQINETLKRYIAFYLFMSLGFFYTGKEELFINNIIEFTKNQATYKYKIENFFNSESNSMLIKYNKIIQNILLILNSDQSKIDKIKTKPEFIETIKFLNELGSNYITDKFKLENVDNDPHIQAHNIIKTLVILYLYQKNDKKDLFRILENSEVTKGEYVFIDIIVPIRKTLDYSSIEKLLESVTTTEKSKHKFLPYYIWNYFLEYEDKKSKPPASLEDKITNLINSRLLVPISDDFLLYHKDSENYEKTMDEMKIKKKEDTKIKYIVNKIEKIKEYYSESIKNDEKSKSEIKKLFDVPHLERKAVPVNVKEDINIINKYVNMMKQNVESAEYFKDLEQIKSYPYINFNDFENYGMSMGITKTINVVRYVSFIKSGEFKQRSISNIIQTRVGAEDMILNIVGFMIPSTVTPLQCIPIKNVVDIRSLDKTEKNGVNLMIQYLKDTYMNLKKHVSSIYWIFDEEKDKVIEETYEQISKLTMQEKIKHSVGYLHDLIQNEIKNMVINIFKKSKNLTLQDGYNILNSYCAHLLPIASDSELYMELEQNLYKSISQFDPIYDEKDDEIYDLKNLGEKKENKKEKDENKSLPILKIDLSKYEEYGELNGKVQNIGICQHNISQEKIAEIDKKDYTRYSEELYKFIQQYVILNVNNDPVCKSCGYNLEIKKYIEEGEYDNETRMYVSYATPININLEDVIGYEKYKTTIRQMDKIVEKIATVSNILHLTKGGLNVRSKRKLIVKNAIDLINGHNKKLKSFKDRKEDKTKNYGINKNYSIFWNFELENSIFVFSSKDIDKYKPIKQNNIFCYLIFLMLMELNQSHITYMGDDKKKHCNFNTFDKAMDPLFGGLKIIVNNKGDIKNISDYKILCYIIYIISCTMVVSTKMWDFKAPQEIKKAAIVPMMQRSVIHTLIDIINRNLEIAINDSNDVLFSMISSRFFKKIQTIFNDEDLYKRLKKEAMASSSGDKKASILVTQGNISLTGKYVPMDFAIPERIICKCPTLRIKNKPSVESKYYGISNISNCNDGQFHMWKTEKNEIICKLCNKKASELIYDDKASKNISKKLKDIISEELAEKICLTDGARHVFEMSASGEDICQKCHKSKNYKYSEEEKSKVYELVIDVNMKKEKKMIENENGINDFYNKKINYINTAVGKVKSEFNKDKKMDMEFLKSLMDEIQKIIGNEFSNFNLTENLYIIDHDHLGNSLDKNIIISESQKKITEKQNHPFFKTNVIYYTNHKYGKIDVFYDATTKILLGYKEENKQFVLKRNYGKKIKLNYSILNKIKLLGFKTPFIKTDKLYAQIIDGRENLNTDNKTITKKIIENIINERITQLKKIVTSLKIVLSRILNNHSDETTEDELNKQKFNQLIEKYRKKLVGINLTDKSGNGGIFKHWKAMISGINIDDLDKLKLDYDFSKQNEINFNEINKIDESGNLLTYYVHKEFMKFFEYNDNKVLKSSISHFIVDFINTIFDSVNEEKYNSNIEIKRFLYLLTSVTHIEEIEEKSGIQNLEGIYSEYQNPDEEKTPEELAQKEEEDYDLQQENETFDVDVDRDDIMEEGEERLAEFDYLQRTVEPIDIDF